MLVSSQSLLQQAKAAGYAIGAFNVYNMEGVLAVVGAAERQRSPVMLQLHPASLEFGGAPLVRLCLTAAEAAQVPVSVHLDHSDSEGSIRKGIGLGVRSVMADGSHLPLNENIAFTRSICALARAEDGFVEAELGRLSGTEDGLSVPELEARMTDPAGAASFVAQTGVDALAVCIGNVHGHYREEPKLDFDRLAAIRDSIPVPLVLHGASGLPESMVRRSIELGVAKFNVNTEVRGAYVQSLSASLMGPSKPELVALLKSAVRAMEEVVAGKLLLFGSAGRFQAEGS